MERNAQTQGARHQERGQEEQETTDEPLIIQYTNLLHQCRSPQAKEARAFLEAHKDDPIFLQRAEVLNKVFQLKEQLIMR